MGIEDLRYSDILIFFSYGVSSSYADSQLIIVVNILHIQRRVNLNYRLFSTIFLLRVVLKITAAQNFIDSRGTIDRDVGFTCL